MGELHERQGHLARAESLMQQGLAIREAVVGKDHPDVASSLNGLAKLYGRLNLNDRAELLCERGLAIREAALGKNHPDVASSLEVLADISNLRRSFNRAEQLAQRGLAIREAALGKNHPGVADLLVTLANAYEAQELPERAEPLLLRALAIYEAALGKGHPYVAFVLGSLAHFYGNQGAYDRAETLVQRAISISEAALGPDHFFIAALLRMLVLIRTSQGLYDQTEPLMRRAVAISESTFGENSLFAAHDIVELAKIYRYQGSYTRAERLFRRALHIYETALGKSHPRLPHLLYGLANLYRDQGAYDRAESVYQRTLTIWNTLGTHRFEAGVLDGFALLRLAQHRRAEAVSLLTRANTISEQRLRREAMGLSESRLASFLAMLRAAEERRYSILRAHPGDPGIRRLALTTVLLLKGRSLEEIAGTSRTIYRSLDARDREAFARLRGLRAQVTRLSLDGPGEPTPGDSQRLKDIAEQGDALEADLASRSAPLRALNALPSPDDMVDRVAAALPRDAALVELLAYTDRPFLTTPGMPRSKLPSQLRYLAMVLYPDGRIRVVDLGPAAPIDSAASRLRDTLASRDAEYQDAAEGLYRLAFKPLLPLLGAVRKLYVAPDGQLALVPFAALHDGHQFLTDIFDFTSLTSGRDLLLRPDDTPPSTSVTILADPDYSVSPPAADGGVTLAAAERSASIERFFAEDRAGLTGQRWAPLLGTRQEAETIQHLLPQAQLLQGAGASKERLFRLSTPGILHIATHGFFLEDAPAPAGARGLAEVGAAGASMPRAQDPLLRSGLVLAGATSGNLSNSLVTALELAGLNLWGTQLVVLSACDTGRGEVKRGQGVYGLRRALVVAGAETLVVSLWRVDDQVTRTLMESYYRNLLAGQGRVAALRQAMRALRKQHPHPYYWASFIGIGRDAPLRQFAPANP